MSVPHIYTRKGYERMKNIMDGIVDDYPSVEQTIQDTVDALLTTLFIPSEDDYKADGERIKPLGFTDEPINWGDIGCTGVERLESGVYIVTVEEAAPNCTVFAEWIGDWLRTWGWETVVETEW